VRKRLEVYHSQTKPLVNFYQQWAALNQGQPSPPRVAMISGVGSVDEITARVMAALGAALG